MCSGYGIINTNNANERGRPASTGIMTPGWHAELRELVKVRKQQQPTKNWHSPLNAVTFLS
jgi:hypothetical protein